MGFIYHKKVLKVVDIMHGKVEQCPQSFVYIKMILNWWVQITSGVITRFFFYFNNKNNNFTNNTSETWRITFYFFSVLVNCVFYHGCISMDAAFCKHLFFNLTVLISDGHSGLNFKINWSAETPGGYFHTLGIYGWIHEKLAPFKHLSAYCGYLL